MLKFALAGLLLVLASACTNVPGLEPPKVESTADGIALAEVGLTSIAVQIKQLKVQGVLKGSKATKVDETLRQSSTALDGAWAALGRGDEVTALSLLSVAQGINAQLILLLQQQKEKPSGSNEPGKVREWNGGSIGSSDSPGRDRYALQYAESESSSGRPYSFYGARAGSNPWRSACSSRGSLAGTQGLCA